MALSTNQYGYIIDPMVPFTDDKGKTIKNGFVRIFEAGSSTPVVTYRNFDGATNTDKIELDNSGRTMTSVIGSKGLTYKVCVYDQHHSQESPILTVDKVSVIGANITAGTGSTVVTGLDGLTTKPDGFVDASIIGTDGYVAIDHTIVTDDLDTDAKVDAVEDDRYVPLLNNDVNDPDSKMTLGRLWQWVLGKIKSLSTTITAFRTGDYIAVDGTSGTAKMSKDDLLQVTAQNALGSIHSLSDAATESDLISSNYFAIDGSAWQKKLPADAVAKRSVQDNLVETVAENAIYEYVVGDEIAKDEDFPLEDKKINFSEQYQQTNIDSSTYFDLYCFPVTAGKRYRITNPRGDNSESAPFATVGSTKITSGATTLLQVISDGQSHGSVVNLSSLDFECNSTGYLYVNCSVNRTAKLHELDPVTVKEKIAEIDVNASAIPSLQQDLNDEITRSEGQDYFADKFVKGDALTEENVTADGSGSLANYKVYYNSQYNLVALQSQSNLTVHCYHVTAGKHYRIENCYGNNDENTPYAVIANGQLATTSSTKTFKQFITNGITAANPHKLEAIEFEAQFDGYLYVNTRTSYADFGVFAMNNLSVKEVVNGLMGGDTLNHWKGKKIVWMGTSVPYGSGATTSYVKIIQDALQFELVPAVIPGEALHAQYDNDSGLWYPLTYGSTCLSASEYAAAKAAGLTNITIQDAPVTPWVPGGDYTHYNNYYRAYDNVLTADNADADLWVLDVVPNNVNFALDDFNAFDFANWKYSDDSSFASHRGTFLGALLFLINEIYTLNSQARILLFIGSAFSYSDGKSNFEKLTAKGVELLDIWADINRLKPSLAVVNQESGSNLHPSTFGHECLGKRLIGRMLSVS